MTQAHLDCCFRRSRADFEDRQVFQWQRFPFPLGPEAPHWAHEHAWESAWGPRISCKPLPPLAGGEAPEKREKGLSPLGLQRKWRKLRENPQLQTGGMTGMLIGWPDGSDHLQGKRGYMAHFTDLKSFPFKYTFNGIKNVISRTNTSTRNRFEACRKSLCCFVFM